MAGVVATVMSRLGYQRYGVQGGDWGSVVGRMVALNDAAHVAGLHANFCTAGPPAGVADPDAGVPPAELERVRQRRASMQNELAYFQIQSTKPQTLGYGLNDSPAGLAAWIVEKFRSWCDCDGDVERKFTKDDLLTNITIYWVTQTIASSTRIYYENQRANSAPARRVDGADGLRRVSERHRLFDAEMDGGAEQSHPLDGNAARRAFRGDGRARTAGRRTSASSSDRCGEVAPPLMDRT